MSNGVHCSPCKLKIKINQTLKLISFPSVCSAVQSDAYLPPSPVHPSFMPGLGSSGCGPGLCDRPGGAAGTSFQHGGTGECRPSTVPKPQTQSWVWQGGRQEETSVWSKGNIWAELGGRTLENTSGAIFMSLDISCPFSELSFPICGMGREADGVNLSRF